MLKISTNEIKKKIKNNYIWISLVIIIIIVLICVSSILWRSIKTGSKDIGSMGRPFLNTFVQKNDGSEIMTNIVLITHPFTRDECIVQYNEAKAKGAKFLLCTSYSNFPGPVENEFDVLHDPNLDAWTKYDYFKLADGCLTCFRDELNKKYIKPGFPLANISESDFSHNDTLAPKPEDKKEYDFIYVCLKDNDKCEAGWQSRTREWELCKKVLDIMCEKYKLRGLLVGRINCEIPKGCHQLMELTDFMEYHTFISSIKKCKFLLLPNILDASPRVCSESMLANLPVLMNKNILGGWKYLESGVSGEFFTSENDFEPVLKKLLNNFDSYKPREHYMNNWGREKSGKEFLDFVKKLYKEDELNFKYDEVKGIRPGV